MFEDYQKFYNQTKVIAINTIAVVNNFVNITNEQITTDCFFDVLERLDATFLEQHYGKNFMTNSNWQAEFVKSLADESN